MTFLGLDVGSRVSHWCATNDGETFVHGTTNLANPKRAALSNGAGVGIDKLAPSRVEWGYAPSFYSACPFA